MNAMKPLMLVLFLFTSLPAALGEKRLVIRARLYRLRKNSLRTTGKVGTGFSPYLNTGKSFGL
jgi:hypothetical protein